MSAFTAPAWDVDNSANVLCDKFTEGRKRSGYSKTSKLKRNSFTSSDGINLSNKVSKSHNSSYKIGKPYVNQKKTNLSVATNKKLNNYKDDAGVYYTKQATLQKSVVRDKIDENNYIGMKMNNSKIKEYPKSLKLPENFSIKASNDTKSKKKTKNKDSKQRIFHTSTNNVCGNVNKFDMNSVGKKALQNLKPETETQVSLGTTIKHNKRRKEVSPTFKKLMVANKKKEKKKLQVSERSEKSSGSSESLIHASSNLLPFKGKGKRTFLQMTENDSSEVSTQMVKKIKIVKKHPSVGKSTELLRNQRNCNSQQSQMQRQSTHFTSNKQIKNEIILKKKKCKRKKLRDLISPKNEDIMKTNSTSNVLEENDQICNVTLSPKVIKGLEQSSLSLRERMLNQLKSSRFRYINEQLYTSNSKEAKSLFHSNPNLFYSYHEGFKQQVEQWPLNPVERIIKAIKRKSSDLVVADFGCGDAMLAKSVPNKVHSFDLVALSDDVIVCDIAHTPLENSSIDICVFCLSLMGTNLGSYLIEANRVLKDGGELKIAEVASRFDNVETFIQPLKKYGFTIVNKDFSHNLFYFINFTKSSNIKKTKDLPSLNLKPCWYKKR